MHSVEKILNSSLANSRVYIQENMRDSDAWLIRGLLAIFNRQTVEEQNTESTRDDNGVGFSGVDGQILTSFAKQVLKHMVDPAPKFKSPLSPRQLEICRRKMSKYARQLAIIARENQEMERQRVAGDVEAVLTDRSLS